MTKSKIKEQIANEYYNYMEITKILYSMYNKYKIQKVNPFNTVQIAMEDIILYKIKNKIKPYNGYDGNDDTMFYKIIISVYKSMTTYDLNVLSSYDKMNNVDMQLCLNNIENTYKRNEAYYETFKIFFELLKKKKTIDVNKYVVNDTVILTQNHIVYDKIKIPLDNRIRFLINKTNKHVVLRMLLRYIGYGINGQHCAVPTNLYRYFYEKLGIRGEGFGSPLNSKLIEMEGTMFCTLFEDTDKPFGSKGRFKASTIIKNDNVNWTVNPPYFESILEIVYKKIKKIFRLSKNKDLLLLMLIPKWVTNKSYIKFTQSKYLVGLLEPDVGKHYMNCNGNIVQMQGVINSLFFFSKNKNIVTQKHFDEILKIWNTYEEDNNNQSKFTTPIIHN